MWVERSCEQGCELCGAGGYKLCFDAHKHSIISRGTRQQRPHPHRGDEWLQQPAAKAPKKALTQKEA